MKRLGRAIEFLAWALLFAAAAAVLAVRFWVLPDIERHRERVVAAMSAAIGQPVRIGAIEAGWFGLEPSIRLQDVRVYDQSGREVLSLPSIENRLALSSLVRGELKMHALAVDGLRVQVRRDAEGALHVAGMKATGEDRFIRWAAAQDEIILRNAQVEWHDEQRGAPPLALSALNLRLRNSGERRAIGLSAALPAALGSTVELRAELEGSLADPATWSGRLFAELGYTDLAAWRAWLDYPWHVERGQGALRAWLTLDAGEVREATADVALAGLSARLGAGLVPLELSTLQGRVHADVANGRYRVVASDFEADWSSGRDAQGTLVASALELEPLARIAASLPVPQKARELLAQLKPRGRLEDARLEWRGEVHAPESFAARGKFIELAVAPAGALPGLAGITGSFDADEASARIVLATRKGEIQLPQVFPQPRIALDFLNGLVEWERHSGADYALRFSSLTFSNEHLSGNAHGTYAAAPSGPGSIDLAAQFNRVDAAQLARYLPHASLMGGEAVRHWLTRGVLAGRSGDVRVRLRGDLREFPFVDPGRGQFSVSARLERGVLLYAEGWPRIEDIQGELVFEREGMRFAGRSATLDGVALSRVQARIPRLGAPELEVSGQAAGATADFLGFIQASPVRHRTAGFTEGMQASGRGELLLKLDIPLRDPARTRVEGEYQFAGNDLMVHAQLPALEQAAGTLSFTESTLQVSEVYGRLFGGPVALSGGTQADGRARIVAKGEATLEGVRALLEHPWRRYLSGQAAYTATVDVARGARPHIVVRSPLQGLTSLLPAPFAKRAPEPLPLELELLPDERVKLKLGRILAAEVVRNRTGVVLTPMGETPIRLPERPGILVSGALAALDLDKWRPLFDRGEAGADATAFDVRIGTLDIHGKRLHGVSARGTADAAGWSAAVASQELAGDLAFRSLGAGRLVARLTRFRTPDAYPGAPARGTLEPRDLPSMDLVAERFNLRGKDLGRLEIQGQRAGVDWRIDKLAMANAEARLAGSGWWRSGTPSRSHLEFELNAADAGHFLARIGYPAVVKDGKAQLKGSLAWDGDPSLIDYASLSGTVELQAESGQFLEVDPGIGKLIALMSLQSLPRRIALDFRDVFSKGFGFERISSSGQVQAGVMTVKDFRMRGSSAQVEMSGDVDLAQETQNMRVRVVPSLGDSASTVIALVNPLLAIPAAIAQKILKDPLGHIFAFDYAVTGAWGDPKVAKLGIEAREAGPLDANP